MSYSINLAHDGDQFTNGIVCANDLSFQAPSTILRI
jgi:hypothetical protein